MAGGITTAGCSAIAVLLVGNTDGITTFSSTGARLGVGSASTAFAASQTNLQDPFADSRKAMDTGYPTRSSQTITWKATWTASEAVGGWNEVAVFNQSVSASGTMLIRDVQDLGDKPSSQAWTLTWSATIAQD